MAKLKQMHFIRLHVFAWLFLAVMLAVGLPGCAAATDDGGAQNHTYAAWTGALSDANAFLPGHDHEPLETFNHQTVRQIVRLSLGGDSLQVKVSNLFGQQPVVFSGVHVAKSMGMSNIDVASDRTVTFNHGQGSITVPPGAAVISDPISLVVAPLTHIAISMYFADATPMPTIHELSRQTTYIGTGDQLSAASIPGATADQRQSYYGLSLVETSSTEEAKVVVMFGDSITDGQLSAIDGAKRYPDQLDDRVKAAGLSRIGIVNEGISGNRWIHDVWGPSGDSRFKRDVLDVAGVTSTVILLGINDIGFSAGGDPGQVVTAAQIIQSMGTAITAAKAKGIKVFIGTLLPYKGAAYYSEAGEAMREDVNAWIRSNPSIDGVIDFDRLMRSPTDPLSINPAYNSGDNLHPNDVGYGAMAAAIDLATLQ